MREFGHDYLLATNFICDSTHMLRITTLILELTFLMGFDTQQNAQTPWITIVLDTRKTRFADSSYPRLERQYPIFWPVTAMKYSTTQGFAVNCNYGAMCAIRGVCSSRNKRLLERHVFPRYITSYVCIPRMPTRTGEMEGGLV